MTKKEFTAFTKVITDKAEMCNQYQEYVNRHNRDGLEIPPEVVRSFSRYCARFDTCLELLETMGYKVNTRYDSDNTIKDIHLIGQYVITLIIKPV